jgi:type I restriction enzyme S subunit
MTTLAEAIGGKNRIIGGPFGSKLTTKDYTANGVPVIRGSNMEVNGRWIGGEFAFVSPVKVDKDLSSNLARRGNIIVTQRGTLGQVSIIPDSVPFDVFVVSQSQMAIEVDTNRVDRDFIYYFLRSPDFTEYADTQTIQTGVPHINLGILRDAPSRFPPLPKQREIAAVLSALDDKIELNRKTAATLEEMARALYRSWFVDFDPVHAKSEGRAPAHMDEATAALFPDSFGEDGLPEGWEPGMLADLAELNPEKHSKKAHPSAIEYVDLSNTKWGTIEATTSFGWEDAPSRARMVLRAGDTIVGTVRPGNGSFAFISREGLTGSTGFAVLRPKSACNDALIYCAATDGETIGSLANLADGGAYPAVRPEVVGTREIVIAPDTILQAFAILAQPLIKRIEAFKRENQTLAALRDTLLPRLMSGELNIGAVRDQVDAVQ